MDYLYAALGYAAEAPDAEAPAPAAEPEPAAPAAKAEPEEPAAPALVRAVTPPRRPCAARVRVRAPTRRI